MLNLTAFSIMSIQPLPHGLVLQKPKAHHGDCKQATHSESSENTTPSQEFDTSAQIDVEGAELQPAANEDKSHDARHDVEEIDLHTSSENGWSVHDNPIASDEGFEHEDPESSELHCTNTDSKVASHSNSNKCLSPVSNCHNELDYSSSGSNLHDQENSMCGEDAMRPDRSREGSKLKEEATRLLQSEMMPASSSGRHLTLRGFDEAGGGGIRQSPRSSHSRHVDSWPGSNRVLLKKRTKIKCKFSYSTFFFLERRNWTRVWSIMEVLLGGSICAAVALPIALLVSTICYPLHLDYHFLVPT